MGIIGLTKYVDTLPFGQGKVWESYDLHDTNLIIDGCGLYYYIYGSNSLNIKFGGQYHQFQNLVKEFFTKLQSNNVVPYVVLDGIMDQDEKKLKTKTKRKAERIKQMGKLWTSEGHSYCMVLPRLAEMAFVQVLQEIEVPYAVADFEADCEIASLANNLEAPVMANDSDFYIFNVRHGYIPFQQYDFLGPNIRVKKFSFNAFAKHLGMEPEMSPLLASLIGNDYISDTMLMPFKAHIQKQLNASGENSKVPTIAQFLSKYKSVPLAFDAVIGLFPESCKSAFEKALHLSIEEYQKKQSNLIGYFHFDDLSSIMRTYNGHPIPQWLIELNRQGMFAAEGWACLCNRMIFLHIQSEDTSLPSAQTCVRELRWHYYALAMNCENSTVLQQSKAGLPSMETITAESQHQSMAGLLSMATSTAESQQQNTASVPWYSMVAGQTGTAGSNTQDQSMAGLRSVVTSQTELQQHFDHTLAREFTADSNHTPVTEPESQQQNRANSNTNTDSDHNPSEIKSPHLPAISEHSSSENSDPFTIKFDLYLNEPESSTSMGRKPLNGKTKTDINDSNRNEVALPKDGLYCVEDPADQIQENAVKSGIPTNSDHKDIRFSVNNDTQQATASSNSITSIDHTSKEIIVTELDREGLTLARKKVNLPVPETEIQIHDIPTMSNDAKRSYLLNLLNSNLPFIHRLPIHHQLVVSSLRYWVSHTQVKQAHLAALLVHYVGEKRNPTSKNERNPISLEAVHRFSQWQNVLYWVERFNSLFSYIFPQLQIAKLYDGIRVCIVYERVKVVGTKLAESIVANTPVYHQLYDAVTEDLPRDCHFNQSQNSNQRQNKGNKKPVQGKQKTSKSKECLKGNTFALLCEDSDEG